MRLGQRVTEDEVIRAFLEAEISTERHHDRYHKALSRIKEGVDDHDFLYSPSYQAERRLVLEDARGWPDRMLFTNFPKSITWVEAWLDSNDLSILRYIDYSYWNELSEGTHQPSVAAEGIRNGKKIFDQSNDVFLEIAQEVNKGNTFPPLVLLSQSKDDILTIVEGHSRVTGFALAGRIPNSQKFILGIAADADKWASETKD